MAPGEQDTEAPKGRFVDFYKLDWDKWRVDGGQSLMEGGRPPLWEPLVPGQSMTLQMGPSVSVYVVLPEHSQQNPFNSAPSFIQFDLHLYKPLDFVQSSFFYLRKQPESSTNPVCLGATDFLGSCQTIKIELIMFLHIQRIPGRVLSIWSL